VVPGGRMGHSLRSVSPGPRLEIECCTRCRWLPRAVWTAQELLATFETEPAEVAPRPGTGGVSRVSLDGELLWDRSARRGFPELPTLKRLVRDRVAPGRSLGHSDRADSGTGGPADG
jgi:selenoprotein W-related protein